MQHSFSPTEEKACWRGSCWHMRWPKSPQGSLKSCKGYRRRAMKHRRWGPGPPSRQMTTQDTSHPLANMTDTLGKWSWFSINIFHIRKTSPLQLSEARGGETGATPPYPQRLPWMEGHHPWESSQWQPQSSERGLARFQENFFSTKNTFYLKIQMKKGIPWHK